MGRLGPVVAALALLAGPAGCNFPFPRPDTPRRFKCHKSADCLPNYYCASDGYCTKKGTFVGDGGYVGGDGGYVGPGDGGYVGPGDGGQVTDGGPGDAGGGPTDGGDGGTTRDGGGVDGGGLGSCSPELVIAPPAVAAGASHTAGLTLYLPKSVSGPSVPVALGSQGLDGGAVGGALGCQTGAGTPPCGATFSLTLPGGLSANGSELLEVTAGSSCYATHLAVEPPPVGSPTIQVSPSLIGAADTVRLSITVHNLSVPPPASAPVSVYAIPAGGGAPKPLGHPALQVLQSSGDVVIQATTSGLSTGTGTEQYGLELVVGSSATPSGGFSAVKPKALMVTGGHAPIIQAMSPVHVTAGAKTTVAITGKHFDTTGAGPTLGLLCLGMGTGGGISLQQVTATRIVASVTAPAGIYQRCTVTVTNPDGLDATYRGPISVPSGSPTLPAWQQVKGPSGANAKLGAARRDDAATVATLGDGTRYLVVAGGDGAGGAITHPFSETAPILASGTLGSFLPGPAPVDRGGSVESVFAPALAAVGPLVYMVGGAYTVAGGSSGPDADSVYEAQVLIPTDRVGALAASFVPSASGSPLAAATHVYEVTAAVTPGEGAPMGETPASLPVEITVPAGARGDVVLTWNAPPVAATGYEIYRGTRIGNLALIGDVSGSQTWYDDADVDSTPGVPSDSPPQVGSLSGWFKSSSALNTGRAAAAAVVIPGGTASSATLVVGGGISGTQAIGSIETAPISLGGGAPQLGTFSASASLANPRAHLDARVLGGPGWAPDGPATPQVVFGPGTTLDQGKPVLALTDDVPGSGVTGDTFTVTGATIVFPGVLFVGPVTGELLLQVQKSSTTDARQFTGTLFSSGSWQPPASYSAASIPVAGMPFPADASVEDRGECYLVGGYSDPSGGVPAASVWRTVR